MVECRVNFTKTTMNTSLLSLLLLLLLLFLIIIINEMFVKCGLEMN